MLSADPKQVHDATGKRVAVVDAQLEHELPIARLEQELERTEALADRPIEQLVHEGTRLGGAGTTAPRRRPARRRCRGRRDELPGFVDGPATGAVAGAIGQEGELTYRPPTEEPGSFMVQPEWRELLEQALKAGAATTG